MAHNDEVGVHEDSESVVINYPVGHLTQALLHWWYRQEPKDSDGLRNEVKDIFTQLCDTKIEIFQHGRSLLCAHAVSLFRVDENWTRTYLLPLFNWQRSEVVANVAWECFLSSSYLYRPLLSVIKPDLLETARHYDQLGRSAEQYAAFLTSAALDPGDTLTTEELAHATCLLPKGGLRSAALAVTRALEGAGDQRSEYWRNRVFPYLKRVWPQSMDIMSPELSRQLAQLCLAAGDAFPEALKQLRYWLQPVAYPNYLVRLLHKAKFCTQHPSDALVFLDAIVSDDVKRPPGELTRCLDNISKTIPALANDLRFMRLAELCRGL